MESLSFALDVNIFGAVAKKQVAVYATYNENKKINLLSHLVQEIIQRDIAQTAFFSTISVDDIISKYCINNNSTSKEDIDTIAQVSVVGELNTIEKQVSDSPISCCIDNFKNLSNREKTEVLKLNQLSAYLVTIDIQEFDDRLKLKVELWGSSSAYPVLDVYYITDINTVRYTTHTIANQIVELLAGYNPHFESKLLYISSLDKGTRDERKISIADRDGMGEKVLSTELQAYMPIYLPNSNQIAYINMSKGYPKLKFMDFNKWQPYELNKEFYKHFKRTITPQLSYQDNALLFMHLDEESMMHLVKFDLHSGVVDNLFSTKDIILSPSQGVNGDIFYQKVTPDGKKKIYKMSESVFFGSVHTKLTTNGGSYFEVTLSPNNKWLAFIKVENGMRFVGIIDTNGKNEKLLFSAEEVDTPTWNQNSVEIAFSFKGHRDKKRSIGIVDIAGNFIHQISSPNHSLLEPHWFVVKG